MGQKVHPYGFRLGIIRQSKSTWFAEGRRYRDQLLSDIKIRDFIHSMEANAAVSDVQIERSADTAVVTILTAKPGVVIGPRGRDVEILRKKLEKIAGHRVRVNVEEAKSADTDAVLIAQSIARQIERRVSFRRAVRQAMDRALKAGAKGIRCMVSGRLQGAEIARTESFGPVGRVPLHTLRADIDYGMAEARTGYGHIGVKVWVYKGEILPPRKVKPGDHYVAEEEAPEQPTVEEALMEQAPLAPEAPAAPAEPAAAVEAAPEPQPDIVGDPQDSVIVAEAIEEGEDK
jgi:small subunit ribosomal protein S3